MKSLFCSFLSVENSDKEMNYGLLHSYGYTAMMTWVQQKYFKLFYAKHPSPFLFHAITKILQNKFCMCVSKFRCPGKLSTCIQHTVCYNINPFLMVEYCQNGTNIKGSRLHYSQGPFCFNTIFHLANRLNQKLSSSPVTYALKYMTSRTR